MTHESLYNLLFFCGVQGLGTAIGLGSYVFFVLLERKWNLANLILGNIGLIAAFTVLIVLILGNEGGLWIWAAAMFFQVVASAFHCRKSRQEWVYPSGFLDSLLIFSAAAMTSVLALLAMFSLLPAGLDGFLASLCLIRYGSIYDLSLLGACFTIFISLWTGPFVTRIIGDLREFLWELRPE
jgi:hypothetical protein